MLLIHQGGENTLKGEWTELIIVVGQRTSSRLKEGNIASVLLSNTSVLGTLEYTERLRRFYQKYITICFHGLFIPFLTLRSSRQGRTSLLTFLMNAIMQDNVLAGTSGIFTPCNS